MTEKSPSEDDKLSEDEATARFNKLVGNLVNTPHKPHKPKPPLTEDARRILRAIDKRDLRAVANDGAAIDRLVKSGLVHRAPSGPVISDAARNMLYGED